MAVMDAHSEFRSVADAVSFLFRSAKNKKLSDVEAEQLFSAVVAWYMEKRSGVLPEYTNKMRGCALDLLTELNEHSFRSLGSGEQYWLKDGKSGMELQPVSDIRGLLATTYPQLNFLVRSK